MKVKLEHFIPCYLFFFFNDEHILPFLLHVILFPGKLFAIFLEVFALPLGLLDFFSVVCLVQLQLVFGFLQSPLRDHIVLVDEDHPKEKNRQHQNVAIPKWARNQIDEGLDWIGAHKNGCGFVCDRVGVVRHTSLHDHKIYFRQRKMPAPG